MRRVEILIVNGLKVACRQTRHLEWIPGWKRIYHCELAKWSRALDQRWATDRWPVHEAPGPEGWEEWERWFGSLSDQDIERSHWHSFD
jgi:hypothetical protein